LIFKYDHIIFFTNFSWKVLFSRILAKNN
jgi:hypothetical protein